MNFYDIDNVFYVSILLGFVVFGSGFVFQIYRYRKFKRVMEKKVIDRRQRSLINQFKLSIKNLTLRSVNTNGTSQGPGDPFKEKFSEISEERQNSEDGAKDLNNTSLDRTSDFV